MIRRIVASWIVVVGTIDTTGAAAPLTFDAKAKDGVAYPWGIADAEGKHAYIRSANGGIEAIELTKGGTAWQSRDADLPLALVGKVLLARTNDAKDPSLCRLVALDVADRGKVLFRSEPIQFPNVIPEMFQKRAFHVESQRAKDEVLLRWVGIGHYTGGARPPDDLQNDIEKQSGIVRVDLATGKVRVVPRKDLGSAKLDPELEKWARGEVDPSRFESAVTIAGRTYELQVGGEGFRRKTTLVAKDARTGKQAWDKLLEDKELPPPPP